MCPRKYIITEDLNITEIYFTLGTTLAEVCVTGNKAFTAVIPILWYNGKKHTTDTTSHNDLEVKVR